MSLDRRGYARYTRAERLEQIAWRIAAGMTNREVAADLGVNYQSVANLRSDPDGAKQRARRERYGGTCEVCGAKTSGCNGRAKAPRFCVAHGHAPQLWTAEAIIDAVQRFAVIHGRPPTSAEWIRADAANGYPARSSVYRTRTNRSAAFGSWADAIAAAGFPRPRKGYYQFESPERRAAARRKTAA